MNAKKSEMLGAGIKLLYAFCEANKSTLPVPDIRPLEREDFAFTGSTCAYYRPQYIEICPDECAFPGYSGRSWSWPGYVMDRTPYGVLQHELGHHADYLTGNRKGTYWSNYGAALRALTNEEPITSYCPNDAEWFAEVFRLFVTNPSLLSLIRPATFERLHFRFAPAEKREWYEVLADAPQRTIDAAANKIDRARRMQRGGR